MHKTIWAWLAALSLCLVAAAQNAPERGPSTRAERERAVAIAHKLEAAPLDESLRAEREWALLWIMKVPDINVKLCPNVLGDFMKSKYKYSSDLMVVLTLSSAAFVVEHPDQATDQGAQYIAGVEGVLKAYQAILQSKPKAKSKALDELLQKQSQGGLADYVREAGRGCK